MQTADEGGLETFGTAFSFEFNFFAIIKAAETFSLDGGIMHKYIPGRVQNEPVSLSIIVPLDDTALHPDTSGQDKPSPGIWNLVPEVGPLQTSGAHTERWSEIVWVPGLPRTGAARPMESQAHT
jgi:hypothetical protein